MDLILIAYALTSKEGGEVARPIIRHFLMFLIKIPIPPDSMSPTFPTSKDVKWHIGTIAAFYKNAISIIWHPCHSTSIDAIPHTCHHRHPMALSLAHFENRIRIEPDWIIPGWLKRGNTGVIAGYPKRACKSWLNLNLGWQLSEGRPVWQIIGSKGIPLFLPPRPMKVLFFSQEDSEDDLDDRLQIMFKAGWKKNDNFRLLPKDLRFSLNHDGIKNGRLSASDGFGAVLREIEKEAKEKPVDLVIFDPMRRMYRGNENDSDTMAMIWQALDTIHRHFNCATLMTHHLVKPPNSIVSNHDPSSPHAARGSGDLFGGADAFINVLENKQPGQAKNMRHLILHFETKRSKGISDTELCVNFDTGTASFIGFNTGRKKKTEIDLSSL